MLGAFKTVLILMFAVVSTLQAEAYNEETFKHELLKACKTGSGTVHLDDQSMQLRITYGATEDPLIFVRVLNTLVLIGTLGIVPMCTTQDATVSTNIGSTVYDFTQTACMGWLFWSQEPRYNDICEDFADDFTDEVRHDLYDQGYIEKR
jgi:hypothetical protein